MTAEPHPQEYVITEDELQRMTMWATNKGVCLYDLRLTIANKIRSRPVHQQSEQEIREDEREKMLGSLLLFCGEIIPAPILDYDEASGERKAIFKILGKLRELRKGEQR